MFAEGHWRNRRNRVAAGLDVIEKEGAQAPSKRRDAHCKGGKKSLSLKRAEDSDFIFSLGKLIFSDNL